MFSSAGFFHFGSDHDKPVESLRAALCETKEPSGALLVLPEAFNIGKYYRNADQACNYDPSVLKTLQNLSITFEITLVVGLIIRRAGMRARPPLSAAYLLAGSSHCTLMCYKSMPDNTSNYTPCADRCDINNPVLFSDHCIAALICRDVADDFQRCIALQKRIEAIAEATILCSFLCVPGCMNSGYYGGGTLGRDVPLRPDSHNTVVIAANSDPEGCRSFITNSAGLIITHVPEEYRKRNKIVLEPLEKIMVAV